jgi:type IV pilus assembly protein PilA
MYTWMRKALNKNENDKGFTLIELLVVIIIIGILAAIAIPIFLSQRKKAVDASMKSDVRSIATQMETFYTDQQTYPTSTDYAFTAASATADGFATFGTAPAEKVIMSPGNVPTVKVNNSTSASVTAFCVEVANAKGTRTYVWQSDAGGLLPTATACDTTAFPATIA